MTAFKGVSIQSRNDLRSRIRFAVRVMPDWSGCCRPKAATDCAEGTTSTRYTGSSIVSGVESCLGSITVLEMPAIRPSKLPNLC